jgi:hypothetical protein
MVDRMVRRESSWGFLRACESSIAVTDLAPIRTIIPADRQSEEDTVLRRIRAGQAVAHFKTIRRRKDGTLIPISLTVSPIHDEAGRVVGGSKIARDISDRKRADAAGGDRNLLIRLVGSGELNHDRMLGLAPEASRP